MQGKLSPALDWHQTSRLRRLVVTLLAGGGAHALVCWLMLQWGYFRGGPALFYPLFAVIFLGHLAFLIWMPLKVNPGLRDPTMTEPLLVWFTLVLLVSAFCVDHARLCVMSFFFAVLQQGVFRIRQVQVIRLAVVAMAGYALMLLALHARGDLADPRVEWAQWLLFVTVTTAMVILAGEIGAIRWRLRERNGQLAALLERIQDMAVKDELTGLYSRGHALELLDKACGQARRGAFTLAVAFVDLDHFKRINDRHGHLFGDRVLVRFAELTRRYLGEQDITARLGGEEFLIILPVPGGLEDALQVLERLLDKLRGERFMAAPALEVTASAGLTTVGPGESSDQVLVRVDRLLYQAKAAGRDRVVAKAPV